MSCDNFVPKNLEKISRELDRISAFIESKRRRGLVKRIIKTSTYKKKLEDIFRHLGTVIEELKVQCCANAGVLGF